MFTECRRGQYLIVSGLVLLGSGRAERVPSGGCLLCLPALPALASRGLFCEGCQGCRRKRGGELCRVLSVVRLAVSE